jgi:hypothetical protein
MTRAAILVAFCAACGGSAEDPPSWSFAPDVGITYATTAAVEHWARETGFDIIVADDGMRVVLEDRVFTRESGTEVCGGIDSVDDVIRIADRPEVPCPERIIVVRDLIGHVIGEQP